MNGFFALLACTISISYAMTTSRPPMYSHVTHHHNTGHTRPHGNHGHHQPAIGEGFSFKFDRTSERMVVISNHKCWIYTPSDNEKLTITDVHQLRALEMKLIQLIDTNPNAMTMSHTDLAAMSPTLGKMCKATYPVMNLN